MFARHYFKEDAKAKWAPAAKFAPNTDTLTRRESNTNTPTATEK
jgi:hypothetical protein